MVEKENVVAVLKTILDPEILMDIWTIGLVYAVETADNKVTITMTLTTPMCPYGPQLLAEVEHKVKGMDGVVEAKVNLTFEPPWQPSEDLKMQLGLV